MLQCSMDITAHPIQINGTDLLALQKAFTMNFGYGNSLQYQHGYTNGRTTFTIIHDGELPAGVKSEDATILHKIDVAEKPVYFYRAAISNDGIAEVNDAGTEIEIRSGVEQSRSRQMPVAKNPSTITQQSAPASITIPEIAERITGKRYLFFTGAGLSANVVPEWNGLMRLMGYDQKRSDAENLVDTLGAITHRLPELMQGLHDAHCAFISGTPSAGHRAIASMCKLTARPALTDNRDLIQQASGTQAIHVNQLTPFNSRPWQPPVACDAKNIDGVVVCGMGGDRRGFIQWLKANNPNAEVIHMDLAPSAQLPANRFIQGDLQTLLPQLQQEVASQIVHQAQAERPSFTQQVRS